MSEERRLRWERAVEWPLTAAAVLFAAAYAWPILDQGLNPFWVTLCSVLTWGTWGLFALDYAVRVRLSQDRRRFVRRNLLDLAVVVLPILRPLRLLRLLTVVSVLNRNAGTSLRGRVALYVATSTTIIMFLAALAVLDAERQDRDANIVTFADALWWSMTTVTTVGYGDRFPVTTTGRMVAASLMLAGIALLGVVTASIASWLLDRVREVEEESQSATRRDVASLRGELIALRQDIATLTAAAATRAEQDHQTSHQR